MSTHTKSVEEKNLLEKTSVGFWLYLMTDCILFASLFATFIVLRDATAVGPAGKDIFEMPVVLAETFILLASSFTCGMALLGMLAKNKAQVLWSLVATFVLGAAFVTIEVMEFAKLISEGHGPQTSAFLSGFFTLVGTHGLHVSFGLLWLLIIGFLVWKRGLTSKLTRGLTLFALFWHFLDLVWIFVFTVVYLMGVVG